MVSAAVVAVAEAVAAAAGVIMGVWLVPWKPVVLVVGV
jgi:hypothetical protein